MTPPDELLTVADVAAMTTLAEGTLFSWRKLGKGPDSFKLGRRVVYRRSVVEAWLDEQEQRAAVQRANDVEAAALVARARSGMATA